MLEPKDQLPSFTLKASGNKTINQKDLLGKPLLLYFYPKDNTPGCSKQASDFTQFYDDFQSLDIEVVGVSPDSVESHDKFVEKFQIPYLLLSDPDHTFATACGAYGEKKNYGKTYMGIIRSSFLFDKNGVLLKKWQNVRATGHVERLLKILKNEEI